MDVIDDTTITHIKTTKSTRYKLNILAEVDPTAGTNQEYLTNLVDKEWKKYIRKENGRR